MKNFVIGCWKHSRVILGWFAFLGFIGLIMSYTFATMYTDLFSKTVFLADTSTQGHYQIEEKCNVCHSAFNDVPQKNCVNCHGEELRRANDSHSVKKFRDPRNADDLAKINVLKCVTCHAEHKPDVTRKMGVTIAPDFCVFCHKDIAKERPTHKDLAFDDCSKCHNYHNNNALYEKFLIKHGNEEDLKLPAQIDKTNYSMIYQAKHAVKEPLRISDAKYPQDVVINNELMSAWQADKHAQSGVNCKQCHGSVGAGNFPWANKPSVKYCQRCHEEQGRGFLSGKHGMRLSQSLSAMTPGAARSKMKIAAADKSMSCNACHGAHKFDTVFAAIDACLNCHDDEHSKNYKKSKHYTQLVKGQKRDVVKTSGVSCASCHLPREITRKNGLKYIYTEHNQNANLRPNQQMARNVCMNCHGLAFSLNALADRRLITNNFDTKPNDSLGLMKMVQENIEFNQRKRRRK